MKTATTKERLLEAAINLFATKGYDATGVDEIAESIGIKGPNIYKYYKGKPAVLEAIMERADQVYAEKFGIDNSTFSQFQTGADLKAFTMKQVESIIYDTELQKIRKIFTIEQFRDKSFSDRATIQQITCMKKMYTGVFMAMMVKDKLKYADPEAMALEYIAPISLMIQLGDREQNMTGYAIMQIEKHIDLFIKNYLK